MTLPRKTLKHLFNMAHFAMAQQDIRYYLNGMLMVFEPGMLRAVADAQPEAYRCAQRLRTLLDIGGQCLTEDEVLYLTLHVARLARDSRATGS